MYVGITVTSRNYAKIAQLKGHSFSVNGFSFALLGTSTLDVEPNQQWEFDSAAVTISNSLCPDLVISSTWQAAMTRFQAFALHCQTLEVECPLE